MATARTLRPFAHAVQSTTAPVSLQCRTAALTTTTFIRPTNHDRQTRRTFLTTPVQTFTAKKILSYPSAAIYDVISDVSSYSRFIPYCHSSTVTKTSSPALDGKSYPEEAKLTIGFNENVSEEFWSRVYCVPNTIVEAVSGATETSLPQDTIAHHSSRPPADQDPTRNATVLSELSTRWTLSSYHYKPPPTSAIEPDSTHKNHEETSPLDAQEKTEVHLAISFRFANPVYAALSQAAAPKVAEKMIEAFEKRVKKVVDGPANA